MGWDGGFLSDLRGEVNRRQMTPGKVWQIRHEIVFLRNAVTMSRRCFCNGMKPGVRRSNAENFPSNDAWDRNAGWQPEYNHDFPWYHLPLDSCLPSLDGAMELLRELGGRHAAAAHTRAENAPSSCLAAGQGPHPSSFPVTPV
jgi:hypothetical protein